MLNTDQEYKSHIKEVGKYNLKDTYKWKEKATLFQERGYYTDYVEDTHDWLDFWEKEEEKILNGVYIDGWYIPGLYYFYLNYLPIFRKQDNMYDFPDVYDSDYHTYLCLEHAVFLNQDFCVIKKRQSGFSLKFCVPLIRELFFSRGSPNYIATYEEAQVLKAWSEIIEPYKEHLNTHTPWYRDFNPSKPLNWRVAKEVINESGRKLTVGRKNTLKGLVLSKSPSKGVGGCNLKGTLIKMMDGSLKKVEDIVIGDEVVGKDGLGKKVLHLFSGESQMFEVYQTKGISYIVTPNHKLHLLDQIDGSFKNIEVQDFIKLSKYRQSQLNGIKHKGMGYSSFPSKLEVTPYGIGEYFGFECEDHLYSLEDGTVTHNSAKWIFSDEAGVNPVLSTFKGYISPMIKYGNVKTGTLIISGAVGELKHLEGGLKEYITYPEKNGFYAVDNIWDKNNEFAGKKCGFFVPESWAYFGKDDDPESEYFGQPFIDEHGNSFVERATEYILKQRNGLVPNSIVEASKFDISQAPLTLSECFQYRGENIFPLELLNPQIEKVERKEMHGTYIDLYEDQNKQIKKTILDKYSNRPILNHPIDPKSKNKEGVIQIWEMPPSIRPPYGVYWAGVDIVRDSESVNSPSLNCIHIYKGSHELEGEFKEKIIVAKYMSRPKDKMDWFNKAILLMEWYNAEALVENNVNWFIEEAIKIKKQHKIAKTPQWAKDLTPQGTSYLTKPYGVVMTPALLNKLLDAIAKYIKEPIFTEYNEEDGKPFIHYGVERIHDLQLLRELVNYKPKKEYEKGNYDSVISFGLALLHAEFNEVRGITAKSVPEKPNFNKKNAKLLMRNRFSSRNFKLNK